MTEELSEDARRVLGYIRERPFREVEKIQFSLGFPKLKLYAILYELQTKGLIGIRQLIEKKTYYPSELLAKTIKNILKDKTDVSAVGRTPDGLLPFYVTHVDTGELGCSRELDSLV